MGRLATFGLNGNASAKTGELSLFAASACFWAWFDSAVFRPTFLVGNATIGAIYLPYLVAALAAGGFVLALPLLSKGKITLSFDHGLSWLFAICSSLIGAISTIVGSALSVPVLIILGAIAIGASCGAFQLTWGSLYACGGSSYTAVIVPASIAMGIAIDALVMSLAPIAAAIFTLALPITSAALAYFITKDQTIVAEKPTASRLDDTVDNRRSIEGLPLSLLIAFCLFGLSFGYCQCASLLPPAQSSSSYSDALIVTRGLTAGLILAAIILWPKRLYSIFKVGTMIGIAGFIISPVLESLGAPTLTSSCVETIGYTTFDIATWTLMVELCRTKGASASKMIGCGRLTIHIAETLSIFLVSQFADLPQFVMALPSTVGYGCVVAQMLLLGDNAALWLLMRSGEPNSNNLGSTEEASGSQKREGMALADVADQYALTERETQVLGLLLAGHGRARVAKALCISENTLSNHIQTLYRKTGVHSRQELLDHFAG